MIQYRGNLRKNLFIEKAVAICNMLPEEVVDTKATFRKYLDEN